MAGYSADIVALADGNELTGQIAAHVTARPRIYPAMESLVPGEWLHPATMGNCGSHNQCIT